MQIVFIGNCRRIFLIVLLSLAQVCYGKGESPTDEEIRQSIIQQSISNYPGNCPCPYSLMRNGRRCGNRSAWRKEGGYSPYCYPADVSDSQVNVYRHKTVKGSGYRE